MDGARNFSSFSYSSPLNRASRLSGNFSPLYRTPSSAGILVSNSPAQQIDPEIHEIKKQEKEEIKGLNNRFANYIDKVRSLEKQNKVLETQLKILQEKEDYKSNIDQIVAAFSINLKQQINILDNEKEKLQRELDRVQDLVEENKNKYEEEINKRNDLENDFVFNKKDVDEGFLQRVDLESKLESLMDELDLLKKLYNEEIQEMQSHMNNIPVTVEMDNSRGLDMDHIIQQVKAQYEMIASRSREEAEQWNKVKFDDMKQQANQYDKDLRETKKEITDITRLIQRLSSDAEALRNQRTNLENAFAEVEERGQAMVNDAKNQIIELEEAIKRAKQDMAQQVKDYQDLMNLKLALDIEIATYTKLLEGEESRIGSQGVIRFIPRPTVPNRFNPPSPETSPKNAETNAIDQLDF
ncbi:keratin, type II cytoskeletal 8-like [Erpetoichthys calabaricus]|uniref:Keratin, type II cytoskeletal 8 n=1 Tax=Erpetoichthys calabaricus TaxID=27687 RepID=A0A8C4XE18_ERPCA|nr:keratin, type II cytoskeletal 8-like [Erpetoichthys calabaricus]